MASSIASAATSRSRPTCAPSPPTHQNLEERVPWRGAFREDLFHRLAASACAWRRCYSGESGARTCPCAGALHFSAKSARELGVEANVRMIRRPWRAWHGFGFPGNVRQLNVIRPG